MCVLLLEKHEPETGDWLIKDGTDFKGWFNAPNSFLWVNGKGEAPFLFEMLHLADKTCSWLGQDYTKVGGCWVDFYGDFELKTIHSSSVIKHLKMACGKDP
jgi:hypothetical protein